MGEDCIQEEGRDDHRLDRLDQEHLAHHTVAQQDNGDVDAQDASTDGNLFEEVVDDDCRILMIMKTSE